MRKALLPAALIILSACSTPTPKPEAPSVAAPAPAFEEPPEVKDPNFILTVEETVPNPDDDGVCFTKVFVDGKESGKTAVGRKSVSRSLKLKLPLGNHPVRLEQWLLPPVGEWAPLEEELQPRERFVRIEEGTIARLLLRFAEGESSNSLTFSREDAPAPQP